jgi:hypothetical protein
MIIDEYWWLLIVVDGYFWFSPIKKVNKNIK